MTTITTKAPSDTISSADFNAALNKIQNATDTDGISTYKFASTPTGNVSAGVFSRNVASANTVIASFTESSPTSTSEVVSISQAANGVGFINFAATAGAGTGYSVNTTEKNTFSKMIAVEVNGAVEWLKTFV